MFSGQVKPLFVPSSEALFDNFFYEKFIVLGRRVVIIRDDPIIVDFYQGIPYDVSKHGKPLQNVSKLND